MSTIREVDVNDDELCVARSVTRIITTCCRFHYTVVYVYFLRGGGVEKPAF